jgi:hypothetical protein
LSHSVRGGPPATGSYTPRPVRRRQSAFAAAAVDDDSTIDNSNTAKENNSMSKRTSLAVAMSAVAVVWLAPGLASAHNAAHFFLPDGTCHEVGSNRDAPIVGAGNPNQSPGSNNLPGQLDLIPGDGDQYGARYAAEHSLRLLPGNCP